MPVHEFAEMGQAFAAFWFGAVLPKYTRYAVVAIGERAAHTFLGQSIANTKIHDTRVFNFISRKPNLMQLRMIVNYEIVALNCN